MIILETERKMTDVLRRNLEMPILPEYIHPVPLVTVEKLADALYWIGRSAIRGQTEGPERMKATLALIVQAVRGALEDPRWVTT
jgi:hypothetical protein